MHTNTGDKNFKHRSTTLKMRLIVLPNVENRRGWIKGMSICFATVLFLITEKRLEANKECCSVVQSGLTLCNPIDWSRPGFPVHHQLPELAQLMSIELVMPCNHLILCHPLLFLPSIFPSIRIFSNESVLRIRWPKYWSFSFSISASSEYSGLISFRIHWFDLLVVQGTLMNLLQ